MMNVDEIVHVLIVTAYNVVTCTVVLNFALNFFRQIDDIWKINTKNLNVKKNFVQKFPELRY